MNKSYIEKKYPTYSRVCSVIEDNVTRIKFVTLNDLYLALAEYKCLNEEYWEKAKLGEFDGDSFNKHEVNYSTILMSTVDNNKFSYDQAELYAARFINECDSKDKNSLSISLMCMNYLLNEVKKNVSYSAIELLLLEAISICKELLNKKS